MTVAAPPTRVTERVDRVAFLDLGGNTEVRQRAADDTDMRDVRVRVKVVDRDLTLGAVVHLGHKAVNAVDKVSAGHRVAACAEHNAAADAEDVVLVIVGVQLENRRYTGTEHSSAVMPTCASMVKLCRRSGFAIRVTIAATSLRRMLVFGLKSCALLLPVSTPAGTDGTHQRHSLPTCPHPQSHRPQCR